MYWLSWEDEDAQDEDLCLSPDDEKDLVSDISFFTVFLFTELGWWWVDDEDEDDFVSSEEAVGAVLVSLVFVTSGWRWLCWWSPSFFVGSCFSFFLSSPFPIILEFFLAFLMGPEGDRGLTDGDEDGADEQDEREERGKVPNWASILLLLWWVSDVWWWRSQNQPREQSDDSRQAGAERERKEGRRQQQSLPQQNENTES